MRFMILAASPQSKLKAVRQVGGLYRVPDDEIDAIRILEREGRLYKETEAECVVNDKDVRCTAYVYLLPVKETQRADGTKLWRQQA